jgi:hypothetical protein
MWWRVRSGRAPAPLLYIITPVPAVGHLFPLHVVESEEWQSTSSLLYKILYMFPVFFSFR